LSEPVILKYLTEMAKAEASDLYLTVGVPPTLRTDTDMFALDQPALDINDLSEIVNFILTSRQRREYETMRELNTSLDMGDLGRFRVNLMRQRAQPALVIRRVISRIPNFQELRLPKILENMAMESRGLVLVTGMTGSGKSTTLASMVDHRNEQTQGHIVTIEDPIEYFHSHKQSVVTQREVGVDTESYAIALKNALRQRPDVILVGEIRDRDVMEQALISSETGHLCLATIHTTNAYQAIERVVNMFPEDLIRQVRMNLSMNLKAIVSQRLLPAIDGGLVPAIEIMINQALIRDLIIKGETGRIMDVLEQNNQMGMCSFDQSILRLFAEGLITEDTAVSNSDKPADMQVKIKQYKFQKDSGEGSDILRDMDTSLLSFKD